MKITAEQYASAIPECCEYRTLDEHINGLMLCWGLHESVAAGKKMDCSGCELATRQVTNVELTGLAPAQETTE